MTKPSQRPANATPITSAQETHGEVIEPTTGKAWLSLEPITREDYQALPLPAGCVPVAFGRTAMDEHWFARSPDEDEDGPMQLLQIGEHAFGHCARSLKLDQPFGPNGPRVVLVEKHHGGCFVSGRRVPVLVDPEGRRFVHIVDGGEGTAPLSVPDGFKLESVSLTEDWMFQLPTPTTAYFFASGDSYQGPIETPSP